MEAVSCPGNWTWTVFTHQCRVPFLNGPIGPHRATEPRARLPTSLSYLHVDIGPVVDQELQTERSVCGSCGKMQRSEPLVVGLADVGAAVDQLAGDRVLAVKAGKVERRVPKCVGFVNLWSS